MVTLKSKLSMVTRDKINIKANHISMAWSITPSNNDQGDLEVPNAILLLSKENEIPRHAIDPLCA